MKKIIGLFLVVLVSLPTMAQYKVQKVTPEINTSQDGIYYGLPQTVIKLELTMERINQIPGPLASYSENFLGTSDYIKESGYIYNLLNAEVSTFAEIDPEQLYYIQFPLQKAKDEEASFQLSGIGTLLSYNANIELHNSTAETSTFNQTNFYYKDGERFKYLADYNRKGIVDTIVRKITIDTMTINRFMFRTNWVSLSESDRANEAALKIQDIREQRFNLLTGYQEVNYSGSIEYMDFQLTKMENEYLQLFLGKEVRTVENHTVYVVVNKGEITRTVLNTSNGDAVKLNFNLHGNTSLLPENPLYKDNHVFYRIPENITLDIEFKGEKHKSTNLQISQLGKLSLVSMNDSQLYFDPQTGNLAKIVSK